MAAASTDAVPDGGLHVEALAHRFGELQALSRVSLEVQRGEIVGLVGRNGAGKTTLMRTVMGIITSDQGSVRWRGEGIDLAQRRRFGYMPEERGLYPQMPVAAQLRYLAQLHGLERDLAQAATSRWLERLGLVDRVAEKLVALSHGNQQRVQLAAALVHEPNLLVLDEPFAGLDPEAVDALSEILRAQAEAGAAILFSRHQLELVQRLCDRIVVLERGRVLAAGTLAQLRERFPAQLRVRVPGSRHWADNLAGVRVQREDSDGTLLVVDPGTNIQAVLRAAQAGGPVEHFGYETAGLIDLYRALIEP